MKKHYFKRSELVLFVYDRLTHDGISLRELIETTGCSLSNAYLILDDIKLYLSDFYRYDLELIKKKDTYYLVKVK